MILQEKINSRGFKREREMSTSDKNSSEKPQACTENFELENRWDSIPRQYSFISSCENTQNITSVMLCVCWWQVRDFASSLVRIVYLPPCIPQSLLQQLLETLLQKDAKHFSVKILLLFLLALSLSLSLTWKADGTLYHFIGFLDFLFGSFLDLLLQSLALLLLLVLVACILVHGSRRSSVQKPTRRCRSIQYVSSRISQGFRKIAHKTDRPRFFSFGGNNCREEKFGSLSTF
jgi:hypothetical protein